MKLGEFVNVGEVYYCQPHSRQGRLLLKQNSQTFTPPASPITISDEFNTNTTGGVIAVRPPVDSAEPMTPPKAKKRVIFNEEVQVREYIVEEDEDYADIPTYENIIANRNPPPPPTPKAPAYEEPPKPEISTLATQMLPATLTSIHTEDSKPKKSVFAFLRKKKVPKTSSASTAPITPTTTGTVTNKDPSPTIVVENPFLELSKVEEVKVEQTEQTEVVLTEAQERERREKKREKKEKKAKKSKKKKEGESGEEPAKKSRRRSRGDSSVALNLDGIVIQPKTEIEEPKEPAETPSPVSEEEPEAIVVTAVIEDEEQPEPTDNANEVTEAKEEETENTAEKNDEEDNYALALSHFKTCLTLLGHNTESLDVEQMLENLHHLMPSNGRRHSVIEEETRAILHKQEQTIRELKHELAILKHPQEPEEAEQEKLLDEKRKEIELLKSQLQK